MRKVQTTRAMLNYSMRSSGHVVFRALSLQDPLSMFMLTTELIPWVPKLLAVPLAWAYTAKLKQYWQLMGSSVLSSGILQPWHTISRLTCFLWPISCFQNKHYMQTFIDKFHCHTTPSVWCSWSNTCRRFNLVGTDLLLITLIFQPLITNISWLRKVSPQWCWHLFVIIAKSSVPVEQKLQIFNLKHQQKSAIESFRKFFFWNLTSQGYLITFSQRSYLPRS